MTDQPMEIELFNRQPTPMLVNGVKNEAVLQVLLGMFVAPRVTLDGVEVKAKVYRDGVLFVDTTVPPLLRREVTP